jgi:hypothetical protein
MVPCLSQFCQYGTPYDRSVTAGWYRGSQVGASDDRQRWLWWRIWWWWGCGALVWRGARARRQCMPVPVPVPCARASVPRPVRCCVRPHTSLVRVRVNARARACVWLVSGSCPSLWCSASAAVSYALIVDRHVYSVCYSSNCCIICYAIVITAIQIRDATICDNAAMM